MQQVPSIVGKRLVLVRLHGIPRFLHSSHMTRDYTVLKLTRAICMARGSFKNNQYTEKR